MPDFEDTDSVLDFLTSGPRVGRSGCAFDRALNECPEHVQEALRRVEYDASISAPRIRELLKKFATTVPGETTIRRHRTGGCDCLRSKSD